MEGQTEAADQRVADLKQQLAAAEADAAAEDAAEQAAGEPAPGDGTRPQDGQPPATAEGTGAIAPAPDAPPADAPAEPQPSVLELLDQAAKTAAQEQQDAGAPTDATSPHSFLEHLRTVAGELETAGRITEADLLTQTEAPQVQATLIKLVGDLVGKVNA